MEKTMSSEELCTKEIMKKFFGIELIFYDNGKNDKTPDFKYFDKETYLETTNTRHVYGKKPSEMVETPSLEELRKDPILMDEYFGNVSLEVYKQDKRKKMSCNQRKKLNKKRIKEEEEAINRTITHSIENIRDILFEKNEKYVNRQFKPIELFIFVTDDEFRLLDVSNEYSWGKTLFQKEFNDSCFDKIYIYPRDVREEEIDINFNEIFVLTKNNDIVMFTKKTLL